MYTYDTQKYVTSDFINVQFGLHVMLCLTMLM